VSETLLNPYSEAPIIRKIKIDNDLLRTVIINDTIVVMTGTTTFLDMDKRQIDFEEVLVNNLVKI